MAQMIVMILAVRDKAVCSGRCKQARAIYVPCFARSFTGESQAFKVHLKYAENAFSCLLCMDSLGETVSALTAGVAWPRMKTSLWAG